MHGNDTLNLMCKINEVDRKTHNYVFKIIFDMLDITRVNMHLTAERLWPRYKNIFKKDKNKLGKLI